VVDTREVKLEWSLDQIKPRYNEDTLKDLGDWVLEATPEEIQVISARRKEIGIRVRKEMRGHGRDVYSRISGWLERGPPELWRHRVACLKTRQAQLVIHVITSVLIDARREQNG
jgi:hypothetical protein